MDVTKKDEKLHLGVDELLKDYNITPYIGEFINTITNIVYGTASPIIEQE
jgi:hypothetical protein